MLKFANCNLLLLKKLYFLNIRHGTSVLTKLTFYSGLKRQIPDNRPDVKVNDGLAAGDGFEEGEVL